MKIAHVSDIHFGREDKTALGKLSDFLVTNPVDLVVISGDLTQNGRRPAVRSAAIRSRRSVRLSPPAAPAVGIRRRLSEP